MAQNYFNRYLWLIDTIKRHGHITLAELSKKWELSPYNLNGETLSERTFHNHRKAIEDTFGITIEYDRPDGYYISTDGLSDGSIKEWMLDCLLVNNLMGESASLHDKILVENIPSSGQWLNIIIDSMKEERAIELTYKSFTREEPSTFIAHPYCLKLFKQRWYLLARSQDYKKPRIYSLDRIKNISPTKTKLQVPSKFDAREFFYSYFGIIASDDIKPCTIEIRVDPIQAKYFKSLPLHHSQEIVEEKEDYTVFRYFVAPTFDFRQEILRYGAGVEVLSPKEFREDIKTEVAEMAKIYK